MKKTLLLSFEFPPFKGGVANYYYNLVKRLPPESIVVLTSEKNKLMSFDKFKIYRKNLISQLPIWPKWISGLFKTWAMIKKEQVKIIWAGQVLPLGTIALLTKKIFKLPYFVSLHGTDLLTAKKNRRKMTLLKSILSQADFITANSQFTKNEIIKLGIVDNKIAVIYPCPEIDFKNPDLEKLKKKYNLDNKNILLSVSRLVPRKNLLRVIECLPEIIKKINNFKYIIIGQGPQKSEIINKIKKLNLENSVWLLDNVNNEELRQFYQLAKLFILIPINYQQEVEGLGMVFQEAAVAGLPIIASSNGGITEVVIDQKTGLIVQTDNNQKISAAIIKLFNDPALAQNLGQTAKNYVMEKFQWPKEANKLINLLN